MAAIGERLTRRARVLAPECAWALTAALLAFAATAWALHLWDWTPSQPLSYGGDAFYYESVVKGTLEQGWYLVNPDLVFPFGLHSQDYPVVSNDSLQLLMVKALAPY